jgi:hypothetical protein
MLPLSFKGYLATVILASGPNPDGPFVHGRGRREPLHQHLVAAVGWQTCRRAPATVADELARLHGLCQQGVLTPAEFDQAKGQLLGL